LNDADVEASVDENVVDAFQPEPSAQAHVNQDDIWTRSSVTPAEAVTHPLATTRNGA